MSDPPQGDDSKLAQTIPVPQETYLGDGLYASFDGFSVVLRAPRVDGDHTVALEPIVLEAFGDFLLELAKQYPDWPGIRRPRP